MAGIMRGMNIIAKIKTLSRKKLLMIAFGAVVISIIAFWILSAGQLTKEQKAENKQIQDTMKASFVTGGLDSARLANIESSKKAGKYAEALDDVNKILEEPNLSEKDRRTLFTVMGPLCVEVKDIGCADRFIAEFNKLIPFDYFFLVDIARVAKSLNQGQKAQAYYQLALSEIDKQGGQRFVDKLNANVEVGLDYQEIKTGAGN